MAYDSAHTMQFKQHAYPVTDRWCVHSYYTLCPYAPDGSGRILIAGVDLKTGIGEVLILNADGHVIDRFGQNKITPSFWHTGFWQSWSPQGRYVYYQAGTLISPILVRRELDTGLELTLHAEMEGIPPSGEPGLSCHHGLLYAAGYGDDQFKPDQAPVPFQARDQHGISSVTFDPPCIKQILTIEQILARHPYGIPHRSKILQADHEIKKRLGANDGLTLMTYCVRWNFDGSRFLFYFGNHCVAKERKEPRISYVFTADRQRNDIHLAIDLSFGKPGVHWGWQPDGEKLIGYGPDPNSPTHMCLAEVRYDGSDYRKLSDHCSGGHPSVCPADSNLIVTDQGGPNQGVVFISRKTGCQIAHIPLLKFIGEHEASGRNALRVCHHPVFNHEGNRVLCNTLSTTHATLTEIILP